MRADIDALGAYGLRVDNLPGARQWMQCVPRDAPGVELCVEVGMASRLPSTYDSEAADLRLTTGGRLIARRGTTQVRLVLPSVPPDHDLLHPYLAPAAALMWRWRGHEACHAGVFEGRGGAVLVLGGKQAGKSTTLGWLSREGVTVLADDLAVIDGNRVLAGPRSIDLREPGGTVAVRSGERRRLTLPPAPASLRLAGIAVLEWGDEVEVASITPTQAWKVLATQRSFPALGADPVSVLDLVSVPAVRVVRPQATASVVEAGRRLMATFG